MKNGKACGPSGVVTQMLKASSYICSEVIAHLTNSIVPEKAIPREWDDSFIFSVFKDKAEAIDKGNYRGLKLTEHVLKLVERIIEVIIRSIVNVDDMQFDLCLGVVKLTPFSF